MSAMHKKRLEDAKRSDKAALSAGHVLLSLNEDVRYDIMDRILKSADKGDLLDDMLLRITEVDITVPEQFEARAAELKRLANERHEKQKTAVNFARRVKQVKDEMKKTFNS